MSINRKKKVSLWLKTIEDLVWHDLSDDYFKTLELFISSGYELHFYRNSKDIEPVTVIKDLNHLSNFRKNMSCFPNADMSFS